MNTTTPTPAPLPEPAPEWVGIIAPAHCTSKALPVMATSAESPPMSPQDIEQRKEQLLALTAKFCKAADGVEHSLLLESLLNLYIVVAETHDCCTGAAAKGCALAGLRLFTSSRTCPQGTVVH